MSSDWLTDSVNFGQYHRVRRKLLTRKVTLTYDRDGDPRKRLGGGPRGGLAASPECVLGPSDGRQAAACQHRPGGAPANGSTPQPPLRPLGCSPGHCRCVVS